MAILVLAAWSLRWIQDDAFISFRYAANWLAGHGLVYNVGERVEGYTNFLWTMLMAAGMAPGIDPVLWSQILGIVAFAVALVATWYVAQQLGCDRSTALALVVVLGTNSSALRFATGGLETSLQQALHLLLAAGACHLMSSRRRGHVRLAGAAAFSLLVAVALLNRLDSGIVAGVLGAGIVLHLLRLDSPVRTRALALVALIGPAAVALGWWFAWRVGFYGDWLPNTFYVKAGTSTSWKEGLNYFFVFAQRYGYLPLVVLGLVAARDRVAPRLRNEPVLVLLTATVIAWALYVVRVGGDYMEFRFIVPVLPLALLVGARVCALDALRPRVRQAVVVALLVASVAHGLTFNGDRYIERIGTLSDHMGPVGGDWPGLGQKLALEFGSLRPEPVLAVAAAGALPYYSGLPSVDMRGITDAWVARHGLVLGSKPGHQRLAPLAYLLDYPVDLVVGHPAVRYVGSSLFDLPAPELLAALALPEIDPSAYPRRARFVEIPFGRDLVAVVLDLGTHATLGEHVDRRGWSTRYLHP